MAGQAKAYRSDVELYKQKLFGVISDVIPCKRYTQFVNTYFPEGKDLREYFADFEVDKIIDLIAEIYNIDVSDEILTVSNLYKILYTNRA